jgi:hypothetical protein
MQYMQHNRLPKDLFTATRQCPSLLFMFLLLVLQVHLKEEHNVEPLLYKANNQYGDYVCQVSDLLAVSVQF